MSPQGTAGFSTAEQVQRARGRGGWHPDHGFVQSGLSREAAGEDYSVVLVEKDRETKLILAHDVLSRVGTLSG